MRNLLLAALFPLAIPALNPVVLVPGFGSTGLIGSGVDVNVKGCPRNYNFNQSGVVAWNVLMDECWTSLLELNLNESTLQYIPQAGVFVEPFGINSIEGVEIYARRGGITIPTSFYKIIRVFVEQGYVRDESLFGFVYDWRLPPWQVGLHRLKESIETAVEEQGKKAVLVAHSLGALVVTYFLNTHVDAEWKANFIESFIWIDGVNAGSTEAVSAVLSGHIDALSIKWLHTDRRIRPINPSEIRDFSRSIPSMLLLLPNPQVYGPENALVRVEGPRLLNLLRPFQRLTPDTELYTFSNWTALLPPAYREEFALVSGKLGDLAISDPGVATHCIWGNLADPLATAVEFTYTDSELKSAPAEVLGEGDGLVPLRALTICENWNSSISAAEFPNEQHSQILRNRDVIEYLVSLVTKV